MRNLSVRARTTIAAVVVLLPALCLASGTAVLLQRHQLEHAVALVAEEQARSVAREVVDSGSDPVEPISQVLGDEETLVQVVGADGSVREASTDLAGRAALVGAPGGAATTSTVAGSLLAEGESYEVVAVPTPDGGYVLAARSLETVDVATASSVRLLAVGVPLLVALIAAICWVLTGRALRPVEDLRRRASEITATGAEARLPMPGTGDEIARLADTLNAMLERLDTSARAQRQFVADASHELRSPVAAIRTVMEVAPPGTEPWEEARADVLTESERLGRLVDALLLLARRDAGVAGTTDQRPTALIDIVATEAERPRRVPIACDYRADPWVHVDRRSLTAAISNLLDNADRHATSGVSVVVDTVAGRAVVRVGDDGNGIPDDQRERVFKRFVRLDEARSRDAGGAGLGLAIARSVARDHGGEVEIAPDEGRGATLVLTLPLV